MATPTYQWYRNNSAIDGATGASLSLRNVQAADAGSYTVAITSGPRRLTSTAAALTVTESPAPTPAVRSGGAGGGAMEPGFAAALLLLITAGAWARTRRAARTRLAART